MEESLKEKPVVGAYANRGNDNGVCVHYYDWSVQASSVWRLATMQVPPIVFLHPRKSSQEVCHAYQLVCLIIVK